MGECGEVEDEVEVERDQEDQVQHYSPLLGKAEQEKPDAGLPVHQPSLLLNDEVKGEPQQPGEHDKEVDGAEAVVVEGDEGLASSSSTSSLTFVALLPLVDRVRVADPPTFLKELKMSINSSPIFATESEEMKNLTEHVLAL